MFNKETAGHLAELSKIAFTKAELEKMTYQMDDIIKLMDTVKNFETTQEQVNSNTVNYADLRDDEPTISSFEKKDTFIVPKIM